MKILKGKGVLDGCAEGTLHFIRQNRYELSARGGHDPVQEKARFFEAKQKALDELDALYDAACRRAGKEEGEVFTIHKMMLEDGDFLAEVGEELAMGSSAEYAALAASESLSELLMTSHDAYMQERAADVRDVGRRLVRLLTGEESTVKLPKEAGKNWILCADDLSPSETVELERDRIAAFVTAKGSPNSHTAILARSMGLPALLGVGEALFTLEAGAHAFVDAKEGRLIVSADEKTAEALRARMTRENEEKRQWELARGKEIRTKGGRRLMLYANIGQSIEAEAAYRAGADGIGLFRSEFLFLGRKTPPDENEQLAAYKEALLAMHGARVIVRTLDIGADKQVSYLHTPKEENPALGLRGIRLCFRERTLFLTQLRALLQAALFGKLALLLPMITSAEEVRRAKRLLRMADSELTKEGKPHAAKVELGVMIETPAAALISDELAREVDFFSIGTNDLAQYTLAIDRQNEQVLPFFAPHHRALFKLIEMTVENAHRKGIWVGICGEMAADPTLSERFLAMEIDELSVAPASLGALRYRLVTAGEEGLQ